MVEEPKNKEESKSSLERTLLGKPFKEIIAAFEGKLRYWIELHASTLTAIVRENERRYGAEGKTAARSAFLQVYKETRHQPGDPEIDLHRYCDDLERECAGTHEWIRIVDQPKKIKYNFTKCMLAEAFRKLGAADIGTWYCDTDEILIKAYNPRLGFRRTKTLMNGDPYCDHEFFVER